jgi:hypothetical protein
MDGAAKNERLAAPRRPMLPTHLRAKILKTNVRCWRWMMDIATRPPDFEIKGGGGPCMALGSQASKK